MPAELLLCASLDHLHRLHQAGADLLPSSGTPPMPCQCMLGHVTNSPAAHRARPVQLNASKGAEGIKEVRQAFSYTLDRMGAHAQSGPLWQDYLAFLKGPQPGSPQYLALYSGPSVPAGQEEGHRAAVLRCGSGFRVQGLGCTRLQLAWHQRAGRVPMCRFACLR